MVSSDITDSPIEMLAYAEESISITSPERTEEKIKTYRSTYEFGSPRRYKSVVYLEPRLAPVRYWRNVNFGDVTEFRHKSGVDCAFRPRPNNFSETAWIFPRQGKDIITSQLEAKILVNTHWYKSRINPNAQTGFKGDKAAITEDTRRDINETYAKKLNSVGHSEDSLSDSSLSGSEEI